MMYQADMSTSILAANRVHQRRPPATSGRWRRALAASSIGLAAVGCGNNQSAPDAGNLAATALDLTLPATHSHPADGRTMHATWSMVANLSFDPAGGAGWLAIDGLLVDGQAPIDQPTTKAVALSGTREAAGVKFAPFTVTLPGVQGSVSFDKFLIDPAGDLFKGTAGGTFHVRTFDQIEDWIFDGDLMVTPDRTPPRAFADAWQSASVARDPVTFLFSEPVDVSNATITAMTGSGSLSIASTPTLDPVSGRAIAVGVVPGAYWPSGTSVTTTFSGLVDAAGNAGGGTAQVVIPPAPDPSSNLGFESGMTGWLKRSQDLQAVATPSVTVYNASGPTSTVLAPVGALMGDLPTGAAITGVLVPPSGATSVSLDVALINISPVVILQNANRGLFIEIVTPSGSVTAATGGDLPRPTDPQARWTGFHTLTVTLPADASSGFWLTIRAGAYEPPINSPKVLVDNIQF